MRWPRLISIIAPFALVIAASCSGQFDPIGPAAPDAGNSTGSPARELFDNNVAPILEAACAACHRGVVGTEPYKFMGGSAQELYAAVTADPSITGGYNPAFSNLLNKGEHEAGLARAFTEAERVVVVEWITAEQSERNVAIDTGVPPQGQAARTAREALAQFAACMTIGNWEASQVNRWHTKEADGRDCNSCHTDGAGGFAAPSQSERMFQMNRMEIYIKSFFTVETLPDGTHRVVINRDKLVAKGNTVGHPEYDTDEDDEYFEYLQDFYDRTSAAVQAGGCPGLGFETTPPPR